MLRYSFWFQWWRSICGCWYSFWIYCCLYFLELKGKSFKFTCSTVPLVKTFQIINGHKYITKDTHKIAQVVTDLQTSRNKVVVQPISGCVRTTCSQLLWQVWNKLLSSCYVHEYKVDDDNILATSCSNKT